MTARSIAAAALATASLLLAACGERSLTALPAGPTAPEAGDAHRRGVATVRLRILVPKRPHSGPFARAILRNGRKNPYYIATDTSGIKIQMFSGSSSTTVVADISAASAYCTSSNGPRTCTVPISAPIGSDTFVLTTYDRPPSGASFPAGAHELAIASAALVVAQGKANVLPVTLYGIIASATVQVTVPYLHGTIASQQRLGVNGLDADGNVILSDDYYDAAGSPAPIVLSTSGPGPGGGRFSVSPAPSTIASQPPDGIELSYDGGATVPNTGKVSLSGAFTETLTASANGATPGRASIQVVSPTFTKHFQASANAVPQGLAFDGSGNLWMAETALNRLGRLAPNGTFTQAAVLPKAGSVPFEVALGSDGAIWFTEQGGDRLGRIANNVLAGEYPLPAGGKPWGLTAGPDSNLWVCDWQNDAIDRVSTGGSVLNVIKLAAGTSPEYIISGPNGSSVWFSEPGAAKIGIASTSTAKLQRQIALGTDPAGKTPAPTRLAAYAGYVWFVDAADPTAIGRIDTSTYAVSWSRLTDHSGKTVAGARDVAAGGDGHLWVLGYDNFLLRIDAQNSVTGYYYYTNDATSGTGAASLTHFVLGPDGNFWFDDANYSGRIWKAVW